MPHSLRSRLAFVGLALATIAVGLLVHLGVVPLGTVARDVLGDALWAVMIGWWVGALMPTVPVVQRGPAAYAICVLVEVSQRYNAPLLDAVRETRLGHLVLGSGFDPRDLLAYAAGVAAAVMLESALRRWGWRVAD